MKHQGGFSVLMLETEKNACETAGEKEKISNPEQRNYGVEMHSAANPY